MEGALWQTAQAQPRKSDQEQSVWPTDAEFQGEETGMVIVPKFYRSELDLGTADAVEGTLRTGAEILAF